MSKIKWFGPVVAVVLLALAIGSPTLSGKGKPGGGGGSDAPLTNAAFVYRDNFDRALYLISSDGSQNTRLTNTKGKQGDLAPAFSPDLDDSTVGHQGVIAFLRRPDDTKIWSDLYTVRPDGTGLTFIRSFDGWEDPVPDGETVHLTWSPDGSRIVYSTWDGIWAVDGNGNLEHILDDAVLKENVDDLVTADQPDFSPDLDPADGYQGQIAFRFFHSSQDKDIWTLDVEIATTGELTTGALTNLTNGSHINPSRPKWSPDGFFLAFHNFNADANDIVLFNLITQQSNVIFTKQHGGSETMITWSPDGAYIGFVDHDYAGTDTRDLFYVSPWDLSRPIVNVTLTSRLNEVDLDWSPAWVNDVDP